MTVIQDFPQPWSKMGKQERNLMNRPLKFDESNADTPNHEPCKKVSPFKLVSFKCLFWGTLHATNSSVAKPRNVCLSSVFSRVAWYTWRLCCVKVSGWMMMTSDAKKIHVSGHQTFRWYLKWRYENLYKAYVYKVQYLHFWYLKFLVIKGTIWISPNFRRVCDDFWWNWPNLGFRGEVVRDLWK